jgi:hypothetical protein
MKLSLLERQFWHWGKWSTIWVEGYEVKFAWKTNVFYGDFWVCSANGFVSKYFNHVSDIIYCACDCGIGWEKLFKVKIVEELFKVNDVSRSTQWIGYFMYWEKLLNEVDSNTIINEFASRNVIRNFWGNIYKDLKLFWYIRDFYHSKFCYVLRQKKLNIYSIKGPKFFVSPRVHETSGPALALRLEICHYAEAL